MLQRQAPAELDHVGGPVGVRRLQPNSLPADLDQVPVGARQHLLLEVAGDRLVAGRVLQCAEGYHTFHCRSRVKGTRPRIDTARPA